MCQDFEILCVEMEVGIKGQIKYSGSYEII